MSILIGKGMTKSKIAAIIIILSMAFTVMALPMTMVKAQETGINGESSLATPIYGQPSPVTGGPIPSGVTPEYNVPEEAYIVCTPHTIGLGSQITCNVWTTPPPGANRAHTGYTVVFTEPNGNTLTIGPFNSYVADGTAWFELTVNQVGVWKYQFSYAGDYYPPGNYLLGVESSSNPTSYAPTLSLNTYPSTYYEPATSPVGNFTVRSAPVFSWPPSPLPGPGDYWSTPISPDNREWYSVTGNYPWQYYVSANKYLGPYVIAPTSSHIVWSRLGAISGLDGGEAGVYGSFTGGGTPSLIYDERCYQTWTEPGVGSVAACYNLQTGQIYYQIPIGGPTDGPGVTPTSISYTYPTTSVVGGVAGLTYTITLLTVSGGFLYNVNPYSGAITLNVSIAPCTTGTFYNNAYELSFQTIGTNSNGLLNQYRLINWTTTGTGTFESRIISNISWPAQVTGTASTSFGATLGAPTDFANGVSFNVLRFEIGTAFAPGTGNGGDVAGGAYGSLITGISLETGQVLYNFTTTDTGFFPSDSYQNGICAVVMENGYTVGYNDLTGAVVWKSSPINDYPMGEFGAYSMQAAYGLFFWQSYDGVYAYNATNGHQVWHTIFPSPPYETPYMSANGTNEYPLDSGGEVADGMLFTWNQQHNTIYPVERGWSCYALNATTGALIWTLLGQNSVGPISDGYITLSDAYNGYEYVVGMGQSATTVTATTATVTAGTPALIQGTVMDESPITTTSPHYAPGQGVPCVSDASMDTWMSYLYMQEPIAGVYGNATITGVPVTLTATSSTGTTYNIGTVTTNGYYGTFTTTWIPPAAGLYTISAVYAGDDSYGYSAASTGLSVAAAPPAATPAPTPVSISGLATTSDVITYIIIAVIVIVIAIAIVGALLLRKHA